MYEIINTSQYKKDTKLLNKQRKNPDKLTEVLNKLINNISLEEKYRDHKLSGSYENCRECHIEPDWLLIYKINKKENKLYLLRTGSHSELFNEDFIFISKCKNLNEQIDKVLYED